MTRKWEVVDDGDRDFTGIYDVWIEIPDKAGDGGKIVGACWRDHANLIAAAPDLLEAAQKLMRSIQEMDPDQRGCSTVAYAEMFEAITKATRNLPTSQWTES